MTRAAAVHDYGPSMSTCSSSLFGAAQLLPRVDQNEHGARSRDSGQTANCTFSVGFGIPSQGGLTGTDACPIHAARSWAFPTAK